jgi:DNA-binding CsgD family transcriptional regulator
VLTLLRSLAGTHPVVVGIDDLPWLDTPSALVLSFALRRLRLEAVGVLAAVRTDWWAGPPRLATDAIPEERVDRLRLGPLSLAAIRELLSTRATPCPGRSLLVRLYQAAGGNPLFAMELAGRATTGIVPGPRDSLDVPDSLQRLVAGRITGLPRRTRDVLLVCALAEEPTVPLVYTAARQPATARADLHAGVQAGLLLDAGGQVTFVHPLMRSVVIGQARAADRRAAHRRLAAVVRGAEARARHLALEAEGPDEAAAGEVEAAARTAACRGAWDTAGDLAELAVALTPLAEPERQRRRIVLAAEQRFEASDPICACSLLESVVDAEPPGPARAELLRRMARYRVSHGEPPSSWAASLGRVLEEAGGDHAARTAIMMDQVVAATYAAEFPEAIRSATMVLETAERAGDKPLEAQSCAALALAEFLHGGGTRPDLISRALAGPEQSPSLSIDLRPRVAVGHILHLTDDLDGARTLYQQEYARAREQGVQAGLPLLLRAQAENEGRAGNWPRAEHLIAEGYRLAEDSGSPAAMAYASASRGLLHAYQGRIAASQLDAARAVELASNLGMPLLAASAAQAFGIAALSSGDARGAQARLAPFLATIRVAGIAEPGLYRFLPDGIEALTRLGDLGEAETLLAPFEIRSAQLGRGWGMATAGRCRGLLLAARGNLAGAEEVIEAAVAMHQHLPMPFEEARTLLAAGEIHRRARHKQRAAGLLQAALVIFERLGAALWQRRVLGELMRGGGHSAPTENRQVLTAAEQRVADLVAVGHTNPEIAAELFMGQRTVEAHLSKVFRKLGVRSRTELCRALILPGPRPMPAPEPRENMRVLRICPGGVSAYGHLRRRPRHDRASP